MQWHPTQFFCDGPPKVPFVVLVLNQPINRHAYQVIKRHASFILCADGGANRFLNLTQSIGSENVELPDAIVGDLDSIHPEVREYYENLNVEVVQDKDQYSTDFTKCLRYLHANSNNILNRAAQRNTSKAGEGSKLANRNPGTGLPAPEVQKSHKELDIVVLGGLGGRVDQGFSQIHHLYCASHSHSSSTDNSWPDGELYLVSEESITFFLRVGKNVIHTPGGSSLGPHEQITNYQAKSSSPYLSENIGIIPVMGPSIINTKGFEWDVNDWKTEFGGLLSTSNHIRAEVVEVETTAPVLFTAELAPMLKSDYVRDSL
ncbi:hypothetical protein FQN57_001398 [Myotisia sp. PD_48]|nr:hypothetical protein FQN57_001398 [Myotisia sp. PD_48]